MKPSDNQQTHKKTNWKKSLLLSGIILSALVSIFFGLLALFVVPAPNEYNTKEVSGKIQYISQPDPESGDIGIVLENKQSFYINRADEIPYLDLDRMLSDLHIGDSITLTVVSPLIWRILPGNPVVQLPIAGVHTEKTVYMDASISAAVWKAQAGFSRITIISLCCLLLIIILYIFMIRNQRSGLNS